MSESIEDLIQNKDDYQKKANELKDKRNQLHLKSKKLADDRDSLNSTVREMRNKISEHKNKRDELNERVKHAKEQRDSLNQKCFEIKKEIRNIERKRSSADGTNIATLRKQLHQLEFI